MSDDLFFPVAERGLYLPLKDGSFQPSGYKAIIKAGTDKPIVLATVKNSYKLVTHREIYDSITPLLKDYNTTIDTYYDRDGAKGYIDVIFDNVANVSLGNLINFRAIFYNGYGSSAFGAKIGAINTFCTNGMILGEYEATYRRHTSGLDVGIVQDWLKEGIVRWDVVGLRWQRWRNECITPDMSQRIFMAMSDNELHRIRMAQTLVDKYIPRYGETKFALYQTLTDYASHYDDYKSRAVNSNSPHERELSLLVKAESVMSRIAA